MALNFVPPTPESPPVPLAPEPALRGQTYGISAPFALDPRAPQPHISIHLADDEPGRCRIEVVTTDGETVAWTFPEKYLLGESMGMTKGMYDLELFLLGMQASNSGTDVVEEPDEDTGGDTRCLTPRQVQYSS